jgi:glycosyltransferase involved in cell wall biosynthesis
MRCYRWPMKILYHHRVGSKDGQVVHIEEIVAALEHLGHRVVVVGPGSTKRASFGADAGLAAWLKKFLPAPLYEMLEFAYGTVAFFRLWRAYRRERPDVLYERYSLYLLAGTWLKRLTGIPFLLEINAPLVHERSRFSNLSNQRLAAWIEAITWRAADYALPVTDVLAGFVRAAGVDPRRIVTIQNGVGEEFLRGISGNSALRQRLGLDSRVVLGFTGFIREWHGLEQVIDFVAESEPELRLHLLLVGDGPAVTALRRQTAERGISDRVTFAGLVSRHEIIDYVAAFDIAIQPQVVAYASPLKLFEYMALARAIVAPSTPNIREVLTDGETALLFDPSDTNELRRAVERLCADPDLRDRLGTAARVAVEQKGLTWRNNARRITELFHDLLPAKAPPLTVVAK